MEALAARCLRWNCVRPAGGAARPTPDPPNRGGRASRQCSAEAGRQGVQARRPLHGAARCDDGRCFPSNRPPDPSAPQVRATAVVAASGECTNPQKSSTSTGSGPVLPRPQDGRGGSRLRFARRAQAYGRQSTRPDRIRCPVPFHQHGTAELAVGVLGVRVRQCCRSTIAQCGWSRCEPVGQPHRGTGAAGRRQRDAWDHRPVLELPRPLDRRNC